MRLRFCACVTGQLLQLASQGILQKPSPIRCVHRIGTRVRLYFESAAAKSSAEKNMEEPEFEKS